MTETFISEGGEPTGCSSLVCPSRSKCKRILFFDVILPYTHDENTGKCDAFMEMKDDNKTSNRSS